MPPAQSTSGNGATTPEEPAAPPVARGFAVSDDVGARPGVTRGTAQPEYGSDDDDDAPTARMKGPVIIGMIVLTALFVVGMLALIYVRWLTITEPTTAVIVQGDPSHDGATVLVAGNYTNVTATLNEANDYAAPILVVPGTYTVTVTQNDRVIGKWDLVTEHYRGSVLYLSAEARELAGAAPKE